jgi:hypothetical protein
MTTPQQLEKRAAFLTHKHGIPSLGVTGSYHDAPLRRVEFVLHEGAHWITLGYTTVPSRATQKTSELFERMTPTTADSLEIDTAFVTYLAGCALNLWYDPMPIIDSACRNLVCHNTLAATATGSRAVVIEAWKRQVLSRTARRRLRDMTVRLVLWFSPRSKPLTKLPTWIGSTPLWADDRAVKLPFWMDPS